MNILVSTLFLLIVRASLVSTVEKCAPMRNVNTKLFCYYTKLEDVNSCKCSHVILPSNSDVKSIENLRNRLNGVKVLVTVHEFNEGLVDLLKKTKVDGLEVDLRKLDSRSDINDFISTARNKLGSDLYTAVSIPPKADLLAKYYDFKGLTKHVDSFILQTAFLGASRNVTFHPSRLSGLWDMQNADSVVDLVAGLGAPLSKLVIAAPIQGFQFTLQDEKHTAPGSPALEVKSITREELCKKMSSSNWTLERDQDQAGPYIFREKEWIAFDDPMSIDIKAKYTRVRGLAGLALKDLSQDGGSSCGGSLLDAAEGGLSKQSRAPRAAVLQSLEREILTPAHPLDNIHVSPYRITRIIDTEGKIHAVRQDTRTEFECSRQGYFVHPRSCNRFYRCVKFNQLSDEFNVFEFDCPAGLAFDNRVEVCVWPGSLSDRSACSGSSEIAPVPRGRFSCPHEAGYYADPENCRWFFACLDHGKSGLTAYEFRCPFGLVFDQDRLVCEWPWLVPKCASGQATGVLVEFYGGGPYGGHGINGVIDASGAGGQHGVVGANGFGRPQGIVLENYNSLGVLQPVTLGGLHGPIQEPEAKIYSSFIGGHAGLGDGQNGQGISLAGVNSGVGVGHGLVGANIHDGNQAGVLLSQNIGQSGTADQHVVREGSRFKGNYLDAGLGGKSTVTYHGNLATSGNLGGKLVGVQGAQGGVLIASGQGVNTNGADGVLLSQNIGLGQLDTSGQHGLNGGASYQANLQNAGLVGKSITSYHGNLAGSGNLGTKLVEVGENDGGLLLSSGQSVHGQGANGLLLSQNIGLNGIGGGHRGAVKYQVSNAGLDGNLGAKSTVSYHGNVGGGDTAGHVLVNAGQNNLGQEGLLLVQNGVLDGQQDQEFGQRGSTRLQVGTGLVNGAEAGGKSTVTYHGNFGGTINNGQQDGVVLLHGGGAEFGQGGSTRLQVGTGLVNGAEAGGKSTVSYHGNFGGTLNNGQQDGIVLLHGGGADGQQITNQQFGQRGSSKFEFGSGLANEADLGGKSTITYHGNFGQNKGPAYAGEVANQQFDQRGYGKYQAGGDLVIGSAPDRKSTVTYHGNYGKGNQVLVDQGYSINSPIDRASYVFGTKLRGGKTEDNALITGEKFATNYIQSNYQNGDLKLSNQILLGGQGLEGQNFGGIGVLTTKDNVGGIYQGQFNENIRGVSEGYDGVNVANIGAVKSGLTDGAKISTVTYHGNTGAGYENAKELGVGTENAGAGRYGIVVNTGLLQGEGQHGLYQTLGETDNSELNKDNLLTLNRGSIKYQTHIGDGGSDNLAGVNLNQGNQHDGGSVSYQNFNRHKNGRINIVGGGFSAVGVYPNTYKDTTGSVQAVTASPVSVTPVSVTASEIPVVTSVPIPITHTNDKLDVYNGNGVVANVPELQVRVESPGDTIVPNIQQTHTGSSGAALEVVEGGYVYDKPAIPFVEGQDFGAKSYAHQTIEHGQPVETTIPIANAEAPAVSIQPIVYSTERPHLSTVHIQQTGDANLQESEGYHYPKPSIAFEDNRVPIQPNSGDHLGVSYSYQNFGKTNVESVTPSGIYQSVQPFRPALQKINRPIPTVSSVHFGSGRVDNQAPSVVVQPGHPFYVSTGRPAVYSNVQKIVENVTPSVLVQPIQPVQTYNTIRPIIKQKVPQPVTPLSTVHFGSSIVDNVTPSVLVQPIRETFVKQPLQHVEVSTVRPVSSYSSVHHVNTGYVENVTPSVLIQPYGETVERQPVHHKTVLVERRKPVVSVSSVHFGTPVEHVTPSVLVQPVEQSVVNYPTVKQNNHVGSSYFYQRNEVAKSPNVINVTPAVPSSVYRFQNLPSRGFEKQSNVNVLNVTPASVLVQQEIRESLPAQNGLPDIHSGFLSSVSKSHGFTKYADVQGVAPVLQETLVQPVVINEAVEIGGTEGSLSHDLSNSRGSVKFTNHQFVTAAPVLQENIVPLQPVQPLQHINSYQTFGIETQTSSPVLEQGDAYYEGQRERVGYYYPKPAIEFNEGPAIGLEPVREEPFVAKKAYVTGDRHKAQNAHGFGSTVVYEENYPVTASPILSSTPVFVSTVRPNYQSTIQSLYNSIPSTTAKPLNFYYHDSRLGSTPRPFSVKTNTIPAVTVTTPRVIISSTPNAILPEVPVQPVNYDFGFKPSAVPIVPNVAVTQSKPILRYSFSSLDSQYSSTPAPIDLDVTRRPVFNRVRVTTPVVSTYQPVEIKSTVQPLLEVASPVNIPSRGYLPATTVVENYEAPILKGGRVVNLYRPRSKAIVKVNDFHPLLSAKLGAQCTCITDNLRLRNKPVRVQIDDGESIEEFIVKPDNSAGLTGIGEGESFKDAYVGDIGLLEQDNLNVLPDYESQKVVAITPSPEVTIGSTTAVPISRTPLVVRKRVRVRPIQSTTPVFIEAPVTKATDVFLKSTPSFDYQYPSGDVQPNTEDLNKAVRTGLNAVKQAARAGAEEAIQANNFDRYGPGGLRSKAERLQGTVDCQRAGLFRHPTECNKFYSCRWDCTKNKYTLHVFNCPVHLTFDNSLGACNWPSQGPACLGNTLLPSD